MSSKDPTTARTAFLKTLSAEEQVQVLLHAEKVGPYATDPDWLVAYAMSQSVEQIKAAVAEIKTNTKTGEANCHHCQSEKGTNSVSLVLWSVTASLAIFVSIIEFVVKFSSAHLQEIAIYCMALAIGIAGSSLYVSLAPYFVREPKRR